MKGLDKKIRSMLILLVSAAFITVLNQTLIAPALPTIMREFSIDATSAQWLTTGFLLVNAIMIPITAFCQEKFSIRTLFSFAMTIFAIGSLLCAWGPTFLILMLGRVFQAVGAGIMMPMSMAVMLTAFPVSHRGEAMGIVGTVFACAPAIGPFASGLMVAYFGWHVMFWIISALCMIIVVLGFILIEKNVPKDAGRVHLDPISVLLSSFGLGCLLYGFSIFGSNGASTITAALIVVGLILVFLFCWRQVKLEHPMLQIKVLKSRNFTISTLVGMVAQASVVCSGVLMPIYIQTVLGYSSIVSGLVVLPGAVLSAGVNLIAGKWYDRHGPRGIVLSGVVLMFIANASFSFLQVDGSPIFVAFLFVIRQFGISLANMTATTWGMSSLDDTLAPHASSVQNTLRTVAASLGTAVVVSVSAIVENQMLPVQGSQQAILTGINVAYMVLSAFIFLCLVLSIIYIKDKSPAIAREEATIVDEITAEENRRIINSIMKREVYYLLPDDSVQFAMQYLIKNHISGAPVVDKEMKPIGFFSDGDFLKSLSRTTERFEDPLLLMCAATIERIHIDEKLKYVMTLKVKDLCVNECICASTVSSIAVICRIISDHHLKKIPITENGRIVGIINRSDITDFAVTKFVEGVKS